VKRLLFQLDGDPRPSAFDAVVAYDAGADHVIGHGGVGESDVRGLVYGTIFTRGPKDLRNTAIFLGGSRVELAERMLAEVRATFFGAFSVSVMLDPNGSNTTAAAAVLKMVRAVGGDAQGRRVVVLAGTGAVGSRAAGMFARLGASVCITSRKTAHGQEVAEYLRGRFGGTIESTTSTAVEDTRRAIEEAELVLAAGPEGVELLPRQMWSGLPKLRVVADVNAVPPLGIGGVEVMDDGKEIEGARAFGAIAIGNLKMKVHKAGIACLFEQNDLVLDAETIYDLAAGL
jgi:methylenetetrahydrofolate/methylenetetrahydromethanopterin dehydrogenase (NADP+)